MRPRARVKGWHAVSDIGTLEGGKVDTMMNIMLGLLLISPHKMGG